MKKIALAIALTIAASSSFAGSLSKPVMETPVIMEDTTEASSTSGVIWGLILISLIIAGSS